MTRPTVSSLRVTSTAAALTAWEWEIGFEIEGDDIRLEGTAVASSHGDNVDLTIRSLTIDGHITSAVTRDIPIGAIRLELIRRIADGDIPNQEFDEIKDEGDAPGHPLNKVVAAEIGIAVSKAVRNRPFSEFRLTRGARKSPDHYRMVAVEYLVAFEANPPRPLKHLTAALQARWEDEELSSRTVERWVARAREQGWLTKGTRGVAGAEPGQRLIDWLT